MKIGGKGKNMQVFESEAAICRDMEMGIINRFPVGNTDDLLVPNALGGDRINRLIRYNQVLDKHIDLIQLNENFLESKLEELEPMLSVLDSIGRLSLIRLTELTLFCVGNYANNNCITEVGDFIINPRLILVHIKGEPLPVKKERHARLSVQFKDRATENCSVVEWFKLNAMIETVKKPILPHLLNLLETTGCSTGYINSVKKQMNMIIELLSYLSMARIPKETNIEGWKSSLEKNDRMMMDDLFYQFDTTIFHDSGEKIRRKYEGAHIHPSQAYRRN